MCSIPGLPTPGSEVPVFITRVNLTPNCGLVEIWANIDDGRKHMYEQMRKEIQVPKEKFCESDGKPGDLCLVHINETWHRARIVSINSQNYNVFLIDKGQPHTATSKTLAWGKNDCFLLSPETESCVLANALSLENNWSERATKFLKSLPGKKFNGLVQDVLMPYRTILLDIPIVSKHIYKSGFARKIPVTEFKSIVHSSLLSKGEDSRVCHLQQEESLNDNGCQLQMFGQYLYPELLTDTFETVEVTEVTDPQHIFCKLIIFSKALKTLSKQIQQHYEENSAFGKAQPQVCGTPCAARGHNGKWHRSLLKQDAMTNDGAVEVLHVDHGKSELLPVGDIRPLHEKFLKMPVFTYFCALDGIKENRGWTVDQIDYLKSVLLHQRVVAKFEHHSIPDHIYYVTLYAGDGICINSSFIERAAFSPDSKTSQESNHHGDPTSSFLKTLGEESSIGFQNKINSNVNGSDTNISPCFKNLKVNVSTDDASRLGKNAGIETVRTEKHPDPIIQNNGHASPCYPSVMQNLPPEHLFPTGSDVNIKISYIESLEKFWCQTADSSDSLGSLMQDMQNHYASSHPQSLVESICVARHPDNGMWYRAKISNCNSPVMEVRFIDYGETRRVPMQDLRPIDPSFLQLNAQAFQCCLFNLKNPTNPTVATWSDAEFQTFTDSAASSSQALKCIVKSVRPDTQGLSLHVVDIETPSESVCKLLAQKCPQAGATMKVPPLVTSDAYKYSTHDIEVGGKEKIWVTCSKTVNHFYCQLDRNSHLFDKLTENVNQLISQAQFTDHPLQLNSVCLARYTDNQWYRGQITAVSPNLRVHFVDYGDTLKVNKSDICPFPTEASHVKSVPVQAISLGLFSVPANVPQKVNQWFAHHAIGHCFAISVVAKDGKGKLIVELYDGSLNVNAKVRERIATVKREETGFAQQTDQQHRESAKQTTFHVPRGDLQTQEHMNVSPLKNENKQKVHSSDAACIGAEQRTDTQAVPHISLPEGTYGKALDERSKQTSRRARITDLPLRVINQGLSAEVYISHFSSPLRFFVQLQREESEMHSLLEKLNECQPLDDILNSSDLQIGDLLNAEYPGNGSRHRAAVRHKFEDNTVHVEFIDFGNEATVPCVKTSYLDKEFALCPKFSIPCTLGGLNNKHVKLEEKAISLFRRDTAENPKYTFKCTFIKETEHNWDVILEDQNTVLAETFLQSGQTGSNMTQLICTTDVKTCKYKEANISHNKLEEVYASCIVGPHYFWCQHANTEDLTQVSRLAQEAGQAKQGMIAVETLGPGSPCLALFDSDKQWYRAQVIGKTDNTLSVVFIDYGNESELDIKDVRRVPPNLLEKAPCAFLCSLYGFDESKGIWEDSAFDDFYSLLVDKPLNVTVLGMEDHLESGVSQYKVKLESGNMDVNTRMEKYWKGSSTEQDVAKDPESETLKTEQNMTNMTTFNCAKEDVNTCKYRKANISLNKMEEVYASSIVGPHYFWCQYANVDDLNQVSRLAQEAGQAEQGMMVPETLGPGSPCLALFDSDKQWYRAQVIGKTDNILSVLFIDYGNESEIDIKDMRQIPPTLLEKAPCAFLCSLYGFDESKGIWEDSAFDDFYSLLVDKPLNVTAFGMEDHLEGGVPQYKVKLESGNMDVNTAMEKHWKQSSTEQDVAEHSEFKTVKSGQNELNMTQLNGTKENMNNCKCEEANVSHNKMDVYASCVVGPHYFWCQYANTEHLNQVSKLAQEAGQSEQGMMVPKTLGPGSPCLALFDSDKQWYRAQVIRKSDSTISVVFIDYGNESEVDIKDVRQIPPTLLEKAPCAFLCSLYGFDESKGIWDDSAFDDFYHLVVDKPLKVIAFGMEDHLESGVPQYKVKLESGNMDVNTRMEKYWKGFATEHTAAASPESGQ
uniref:Si:ch211-189e2.3 n=1 Tax=Myripristis murdjan TaxID=586833 RepID=A0A668AAA8_9TELE